MSRPVGRPPKYKSVEEIEQKIEAYFKSCEGEPLKDRDGTVLTDKYAEERLFDREGVQGAKFSLINNFKGWSEKPESESDAELLQKAAELLGGVDSVI